MSKLQNPEAQDQATLDMVQIDASTFEQIKREMAALSEGDRNWRMELEKARMHFGLEQLRVKSEEKRDAWSRLSVVVPVIVAVITGGVSSWYGFSSTQETARIQFRQKAAEIIMQGPTTADMVGRADYLTQIFPELKGVFHIPAKEPEVMTKFDQEVRQTLFKELSRTLTAAQSLALWQALFPDKWAQTDDVRAAVSATKSP